MVEQAGVPIAVSVVFIALGLTGIALWFAFDAVPFLSAGLVFTVVGAAFVGASVRRMYQDGGLREG